MHNASECSLSSMNDCKEGLKYWRDDGTDSEGIRHQCPLEIKCAHT